MKKAPRPCLTSSASTSFPSSYPKKKWLYLKRLITKRCSLSILRGMGSTLSFMARMIISFLKMVMKSRKSSTHCLHTQIAGVTDQSHLQPVVTKPRFTNMFTFLTTEVYRQQRAPPHIIVCPLTAGTDMDTRRREQDMMVTGETETSFNHLS